MDHTKYLLTFDETIKYSYDIFIKSNKSINVYPIGIFYSNKDNDNYTIDAIIIDKYISIPIKQQILSKDNIRKSVKFLNKQKIKNIISTSPPLFSERAVREIKV